MRLQETEAIDLAEAPVPFQGIVELPAATQGITAAQGAAPIVAQMPPQEAPDPTHEATVRRAAVNLTAGPHPETTPIAEGLAAVQGAVADTVPLPQEAPEVPEATAAQVDLAEARAATEALAEVDQVVADLLADEAAEEETKSKNQVTLK